MLPGQKSTIKPWMTSGLTASVALLMMSTTSRYLSLITILHRVPKKCKVHSSSGIVRT
jgi:hypothetical protein